jgi:hypothetical protein
MATELTGENMIKALADAEFRFEGSLGTGGAVSISLQVDRFSGQRCCMLSASDGACNTGQAKEYIQAAVRDPKALPYRVAASVDGDKIGFLFIAAPDLAPLARYRTDYPGRNWRASAVSACMQVADILKANEGSTISVPQLFVRDSDQKIFYLPWPRFLEPAGAFAEWRGTDYATVDTAKKNGRMAAAFLLYWLKGLPVSRFEEYAKGSPYHSLMADAFLNTVKLDQLKDKLMEEKRSRTMKVGLVDSLDGKLKKLKIGLKSVSRKMSDIGDSDPGAEASETAEPAEKKERRGTVDVL